MGTALVLYEPPTEPRRNVGGRPTLYSHAVATLICDRIRQGVTRNAAAEAAGITRETLFDWMRDNEEFSYLVARADAEAEILFTDCLRRGAIGDEGYKGDPKMSVEWLKRRRRADYGDTINLRTLDVTQLMALLQQQTESTTEQSVIESGYDDL